VELRETITDYPKEFVLVVPSRNFIREADFIKINNRGKAQERHFVLLSDCIIYAAPTQNFFKKVT
jgi:hypothetical protein